uniref:Uncharacterized protein n=1 Tax=Anguilla anguilla TaxID=7936 RepID=A0A0E9RJ15_ANGAN
MRGTSRKRGRDPAITEATSKCKYHCD